MAAPADRARAQGHGAARAPPRGAGPPGAAARRRARRRAGAGRGADPPPGPAGSASGSLESGRADPDRIKASSSSLVIDLSGRWVLGRARAQPGAAGRRSAAGARGLRPPGAAAGSARRRDSRRPPSAPPSRRRPARPGRGVGAEADPRGHRADSRRGHVVARLQGLEARGSPGGRRCRADSPGLGPAACEARRPAAGRCRDAACAPRAGRRRPVPGEAAVGRASGALRRGSGPRPGRRWRRPPRVQSSPIGRADPDGDEPGISRCGAGAAGLRPGGCTAARRPGAGASRCPDEPGRPRRAPAGPGRRGLSAMPAALAALARPSGRPMAARPRPRGAANSRPPCRTPADASTP